MAYDEAEAVGAVVESNVQSLTASELASLREHQHLTQQVRQFSVQLAGMRQDGISNVKYVLLQLHGLQERPHATASHLLRLCNSLTAALERPVQHHGYLATSNLPLELLLSSSASFFVDGNAGSVSNEVAAHRAKSTGVLTSASDRFELKLHSIGVSFHTTEYGSIISTAGPEASGTSPFIPLVPDNDLSQGQP